MAFKNHIPNSITSLNLLCGVLGIVFALKGRIDLAFCFMIAGATADFFDGFSARLLGAYSPMGKELDSLADQVTFGVLPSVMLWEVACEAFSIESVIPWIILLIAVFSGLRLAKFNIDDRQTSSFLGLPTPACAMICGSLACFLAFKGCGYVQNVMTLWWVAPLVAALCFLLVCEMPMFSLKMHKGDSIGWERICFIVCSLIAAVVVILCKGNWSLIVLISFAGYVLINVAGAIVRKVKK